MTPELLVQLAAAAAAASAQSPATWMRLASGSGDMHTRLVAGRDITTRRAARIVQWLSDHWPDGAVWPRDIPRPPPSPGDGQASNPAARPASLKRENGNSRKTRENPASGRAADPSDDPDSDAIDVPSDIAVRLAVGRHGSLSEWAADQGWSPRAVRHALSLYAEQHVAAERRLSPRTRAILRGLAAVVAEDAAPVVVPAGRFSTVAAELGLHVPRPEVAANK